MLAIFNKELKTYFTSAAGYIFMGVFLLISGVFFALTNLLAGNAEYGSALGSILFVFLILVPVLTMRIISEETKQKTDQLLLTSSLDLWEIVVGKYLAALVLFLITLAVTLLYPMILSLYASMAVGEIVTTYVGFALLGACFISIGLFISSLTENQVVAAVGTFGALLILWILDWIQQGMPATRKSSIIFAIILTVMIAFIVYRVTKNIVMGSIIAAIGGAIIIIIAILKAALFDGFIAKFIEWFSLLKRYETFSMGILNVSSIVYYITFSIAFVFLTIRVIEKRRWS